MRRRGALMAAAAALALTATGCARYYYGAAVASDPVDLLAHNHGAVDVLLQQVRLDAGEPVLVATVVHADRLEESSRLGRLISEQAAGRLAQRGLQVAEPRLRTTLAQRPGQGELLLSRQAHEVAQAHSAQAVLVGTYTVAPQAVYVSLKLVGMAGTVLAAHDYALPMDGNVRGLLMGGL